ncbi:DUF523 domain-containing protein, partial [Klebsiella pneumoniae]|nr:DUF523 domain-containing protein [Klebsiella pneumoniae]
MKNKLLVSACLMGFQVRYNGSEKAQLAATLSRWQQAGRLVIHCPELAAGLPTPRLPAEILGGTGGDVLAGRARIVESDGRDVTGHYQLAAWLALSAAREAGCQAALLTDGSPTCGSQFVYTAALPAAASLSMTVPFADGAKRAPAWPPTYSAPTASRYFPTGKSRSCSPGWHRRSRMMIQCKRVYDPQESSDGYRVLVDRLWPRGIKKEALACDEWCKELTPSAELRKAFHGEAIDFAHFSQRYRQELD